MELTRQVYSSRRALLNPVYVFNACINDCPYCQFRASNKRIRRRKLSIEEAIQEVRFLLERGTKKVVLLGGELPPKEYYRLIHRYVTGIIGALRPGWLGVEAVLHREHYGELRDLGVNAITVFQETYDESRYRALHGPGGKGEFSWRYEAQFRAAEGGIPVVGFGVLYGLGDWLSDSIAMANHAHEVLRRHPSVRLQFSFPRLIPFPELPSAVWGMAIEPQVILRLATAFRLAFPESSLVLSGRESADLLRRSAAVVDTLGKGGSTTVGGYATHRDGEGNQFDLSSDCAFTAFKQILEQEGYECD